MLKKRTFNLPNYTGSKLLTGTAANTWSRQDNPVDTSLLTNLAFYSTNGSRWDGWRLLGVYGGSVVDAGASSASHGSERKISLYTDLSAISKQITLVIKY